MWGSVLTPVSLFTYRTARSGALLSGLALAVGVETLVLHLWLAPRHPIVAWALTLGNLATLGWLVADYRALGREALTLGESTLEITIGRRGTTEVPLDLVASAVRPNWRDIPETGTPAAAHYLNLLKPASPNVLLTLTTPVSVRLIGGLRRSVSQLGFCLDAPDAFIAELRAAQMRDVSA